MKENRTPPSIQPTITNDLGKPARAFVHYTQFVDSLGILRTIRPKTSTIIEDLLNCLDSPGHVD
jgi:hypothetical protein